MGRNRIGRNPWKLRHVEIKLAQTKTSGAIRRRFEPIQSNLDGWRAMGLIITQEGKTGDPLVKGRPHVVYFQKLR